MIRRIGCMAHNRCLPLLHAVELVNARAQWRRLGIALVLAFAGEVCLDRFCVVFGDLLLALGLVRSIRQLVDALLNTILYFGVLLLIVLRGSRCL